VRRRRLMMKVSHMMCALSGSKPCAAAIAIAMLVSASVLISATHMAAQGVGRQDRRLPTGDFLSPVHISGEVKKPGTFPVIDSPTLAQVLEMAGGLTGDAGSLAILVHFSDRVPLTPPSRASLVRLIGPDSTVPSHIKLTRISLTDNQGLARHLQLAPQDILFVPSKNEN